MTLTTLRARLTIAVTLIVATLALTAAPATAAPGDDRTSVTASAGYLCVNNRNLPRPVCIITP